MASQIDRLRAGGIVSPKMCVAEAARVGLPLEWAAALLEKESNGGHNVFGHDRDKTGKYIFPARDGTVKVTKELYLEYKRRRIASGNKAMQGVGPCQLTWYSFQDDADKEGGCWNAQINMRYGFRRLANLIKTQGESVGARMYNGSGPDAERYSKDLIKRVAAWRARLDGAKPVHVSAGGPLRRGDRGAKVVRLTRRLAKARSKAGTPYLAKPRRELDATAEAALKAFQAEHRLDADGVYGPLSQRKLNRIVRLQEKRREEKKAPATATAPAAAAKAAKKPRLKSLVANVRHLDAETGEAWDELVAYAARRRGLLKRLQGPMPAQSAADAALHASVVEGFAAVTAALKEIDTTLDTIVEAEQAEAAAEAAAVAAAVPEAVATVVPETMATTDPVATGGGGVPPVEGADPAAVAAATVTQAPPPAPPAPEGPAPPSPVAVPPPAAPARRELADLSDEELLARIDRLDRALDRARAAMIQRFAVVEQDIGMLAPERRERAPERERKPGERPPKREPAEDRPVRPGGMPKEKVKSLQRALNAFSNKYLKGFAPLIVDGEVGHATKKRIREAKAYLGYTGPARRSTAIDQDFLQRLRHPKNARYSNPAMLARAASRRRKQRQAAKRSIKAAPSSGVDTFEGKQVAAWLKPYLVWARNNGWNGHLNSGWRDPAYSEQLCRNICGAPTCPGRCAGRTSNHAGSVKPAGAVDVSDYVKFGQLMKRCPLKPPIYNALGARDPVHFSVTGR